jgi:hypothetical protein
MSVDLAPWLRYRRGMDYVWPAIVRVAFTVAGVLLVGWLGGSVLPRARARFRS